MRVLLMFRDRDFDPGAPGAPNVEAMLRDFDLDVLLDAMSSGEQFIGTIVRSALFQSLLDVETILYRQQILEDCIRNEEAVRTLYALADEALEVKRKSWLGLFGASPSSLLHSAVRLLEAYLPLLSRLREIAAENQTSFQSEGWKRFLDMVLEELDEGYLTTVRSYLKDLRFDGGVMISAMLGPGNEICNHMLRKPNARSAHWLRSVLGPKAPSYSFTLDPRDESGTRALAELRDRGINFAADALARSAEHVENFFRVLKQELAFYLGCLNLHHKLTGLGEPVCFPIPEKIGTHVLHCRDVINPCLSLVAGRTSVGNAMDADGKNLVIITGVNEGGKSTFMKSIGIAQLMMQAGMFVCASSFAADIRTGIFTHYRRREDRKMRSGKFDEELQRMNSIVQQIRPHSLVLFNESFAATNEREGSEIARQIVSALLESGARILFVTHLHTFASYFNAASRDTTLMMRAERASDGARSFRIVPGAPSQHSHGEDLYKKVFGESPR